MKFTAIICSALIAIVLAVPAFAVLDGFNLEVSNVTTSSTADTATSTAVGTIQRVSVVSESGAGVDWAIVSTYDSTTLLSGTNLSAVAVTYTNVSLPVVGITLQAYGADATGKTVTATGILDK